MIVDQRWVGVMAGTAFALTSPSASGEVGPDWWVRRDILNGAAPSNYSPANIGQAKWIAFQALEHLRSQNPDLGADIEACLVGPGKPLSAWVPQAPGTENYAALNVGQLKALSYPFYHALNDYAGAVWVRGQLAALGRSPAELDASGTDQTGYFPWPTSPGPASNRVLANLGQLKLVFGLDLDAIPALATDLDSDGIADALEELLGLSNSALTDTDGDGLRDGEEMLLGTNPNVADTDGDGLSDFLDPLPLESLVVPPSDPGDTQGPVVTILSPLVAPVP